MGGGIDENQLIGKTKLLDRESGLELLRIIAMILIVMHHIVLNYNFNYTSDFEILLFNVFGFGGKLGVDIFVLISAYFMVNKKFKLTRILNIIFQTTFYSVLFYAIFTLSGNNQASFRGLLFAFLPVLYSEYWFITVFIYLMLISPALNIILHSVNQKTLFYSIIVMVFLTVLFRYVNLILIKELLDLPYINEFFIFIELYIIAGYTRLYGVRIKKGWVVLYTFIVLLTCLSFCVMDFFSINALSNYVVAIGLFLIFKDFKFRSKIINRIASTTFGIYLIHDNKYVRAWLYDFCKRSFLSSISSNVLCFFVLIILIFAVCMIIDFIRLQTIHRVSNKFFKFIDKKIEDRKKLNKNIL